MTKLGDPRDLRTVSNRPTIGDIVALIEADEAVSAWRRRSVPCTVRTLTRRLNCNFAFLPVEPSQVRAKLDIHPAKIGISKGRWSNLRHDLTFILAYAGAIAVPCYSGVPLTPDWRYLIDQVPRKGDQRVLQRFARYCIDRHIPPDVVDDSVADAYLYDLLKNSLDRKPRSAHRLALVAWNRAHESVPDWPDKRLKVPDSRHGPKESAYSQEATFLCTPVTPISVIVSSA